MTVALPDTALVREARALLDASGAQALVDHSLRTFALGRAWGRAHGRAFDEEDLCLAALFHDFGLLPRYQTERTAFTLQSARELRRFLEGRVAPGRVAAMSDAIALHMQLWPRFSRGDVVGLLQVGAWMDVLGLRRGSIAAEASEIRRAFPAPLPALTFLRLLGGSVRGPASCVGLLFPPPTDRASRG